MFAFIQGGYKDVYDFNINVYELVGLSIKSINIYYIVKIKNLGEVNSTR